MMSNDELLCKIYDVEGMAGTALGQLDVLTTQMREMKVRAECYERAIESTRAVVEAAFSMAVHELIEYLRHNDIQSLNEEEFAAAVKRLILDEDPETYLPF